MGSNKKLLLVYNAMSTFSSEESVNIMLTPQFYTMKKAELPVKYLYQARRIAASLFEGLLDKEGKYAYFVFKEEERWVFIAYDPEEIKDFLAKKGISAEKVKKVFFVQQAKEAFIQPVALDEKEVLMTIDEVVTLVPRSALPPDTRTTSFHAEKIIGSGVSLPSSSHALIGPKEAFVLAAIFTLFSGVFFLEGLQYGRSIEAQEKEMDALLEVYPALQSKMQRESISLKYKSIDSKERKKRETIKTLAAMIFKGVTLNSYHMDEKRFKAVFSCDNARSAQKVAELAKKSNYRVSSAKGSNVVTVEGSV